MLPQTYLLLLLVEAEEELRTEGRWICDNSIFQTFQSCDWTVLVCLLLLPALLSKGLITLVAGTKRKK